MTIISASLEVWVKSRVACFSDQLARSLSYQGNPDSGLEGPPPHVGIQVLPSIG